ncbi:MAG: hypothetical protein JWR40_5186 [Massilia sp.]|nr:hypothetical protein [Massilia sp.]MDB5949653.1 hypothetical protein [Massilia sp.]
MPVEVGEGGERDAGIPQWTPSNACDENEHAFLLGAASWARSTRRDLKDLTLIMKINRTALAVCAAFMFTLPASSHASNAADSSSQDQAQAQDGAGFDDRRGYFNNVEDYKFDAAMHIAQFNAGHTFSGKLPRELPAVVVLRITVDESGRITEMWVQRAPEGDDRASKIAMASIQRAGVLPRPLNLADGPDRSLSYSETFLFNADNQFQIRSLAPIQTPD